MLRICAFRRPPAGLVQKLTPAPQNSNYFLNKQSEQENFFSAFKIFPLPNCQPYQLAFFLNKTAQK